MSDEELIRLLKEGNHRYFSLFTDRYEKYILQKCRGYVKDKDAAEDLCQEILIKVFLQLKNFREESKLSTWLYTVIHHTCVDYLRKQKKNVTSVFNEKLADEVFEIVDAEDELPEEKTIDVLNELLEEMSQDEKLIVLLKYKEKHSIKDIQTVLELSESAIKMRLTRSREKLNRLYEKRLKDKK